MFWKNLCKLCNEHKTTPNAVCSAIGKSSATATKWKNGAVPRDTTLQLIANFFSITPEELLKDPDEPYTSAVGGDVLDVPQLPPLAPEFYELLNQMTLQELAELKATMEEKIRSRKS